MSLRRLSPLTGVLLGLFALPVFAELKGYDDNFDDATPAVVIDIDRATGSGTVPPEYAACSAAPNPVNTVFGVGFTSGYAFAPSFPGPLSGPDGETLYGIEFDGPDVFLYTLASSFCATGTRVGTMPVGFPLLESLTYCCTDGYFYSQAFFNQAHTGYLIRIDPVTGIGTRVGDHTMARDVWIVGLAYDPASGHFYGVTNGFADRNIQELYRIDMNGVETLIGPTGTAAQELQSLVLGSSGLLAAGTTLYEINPTSGAATEIGGNYNGTVWAMAERPTGCPATPTPSPTPTATPPQVPTATPTEMPIPACLGDCNGDNAVTVDELLTMVNIALGNTTVSACPAGDGNHNGQITVDEILLAVNNVLNGCPTGA